MSRRETQGVRSAHGIAAGVGASESAAEHATGGPPKRDTPAFSPEPLAVDAITAGGMLGISRSQFFKLHASGRVPSPVYLGTRAPRWRVAEIRAWLDAGCPDRAAWEKQRGPFARDRLD